MLLCLKERFLRHSVYIGRYYSDIFMRCYTVVGDNINIMKTTLELNFDLQLFKQHGYIKLGNKEKLSIQKASL